MNFWYGIIDALLPFEWARYGFMKNALLAVLLIGPAFGTLGTMVVSSRLAFFSDVIGHSALTGVAIGMLFGLFDPLPAMLVFSGLLAIGITAFKRLTGASSDTVLGVFFAVVVAFGIAVLSRSGGFAKYTAYLVGDILSIGAEELLWLVFTLLAVIAYWIVAGNALLLGAVNSSLARSRGIRTFLLEASFSCLLALVVTVSIRWMGMLIINSLLVLPAAAGRIRARSVRSYTAWSAGIGLFSGIAGLILSYYLDASAGATIVLTAGGCYLALALSTIFGKKRQ
jgi:zinc transport system permease protein